jgi:hypothetical protein
MTKPALDYWPKDARQPVRRATPDERDWIAMTIWVAGFFATGNALLALINGLR